MFFCRRARLAFAAAGALICLLHRQQFVCHAAWATRTASTATTATTTTATALATIISMQAILGMLLAATSSLATATPAAADSTEQQTQPKHSQRSQPATGNAIQAAMHIQELQVNCTRELLDMQLQLSRNFRGLLYAKDFPLECRARGQNTPHIALRLPTSGCGIRAEPLPDGSLEYTVRVMLQMEQKLRQSTDILRSVRCLLPAQAMSLSMPMQLSNVGRERNARMRHMDAQETAPEQALASLVVTAASPSPAAATLDTPRVRIWLELGGPNGSGSVEVGVATTLTVRAIVPGNIGVRVIDCAALDGLGESTQQLLDARGCPIDEQVMPALHMRHKPAEEGWSKQDEEDLVERTFTTTFPAFKFPDRERLHVSCGVQLCKGKCPNLNCRLVDQQQINADQHLARIEVFNSLAVTAPQIEMDRLRYDRRYNMSEEYAPNVRPLPGEGTLCLSISKLAISFCVLGLIFLVAVIVAISSLIRTRRRERRRCVGLGGVAATNTSNSSSRLHRADICTSMFSSSSESAQSAPRFGGKFLMPYYPNTLPYGRVY